MFLNPNINQQMGGYRMGQMNNNQGGYYNMYQNQNQYQSIKQ